MNGDPSAVGKILNTPRRSAIQKQGGDLSRLECIAQAAVRAENGWQGYGGVRRSALVTHGEVILLSRLD